MELKPLHRARFIVGEVRANPDNRTADLVIDVAELVWQPIAV